jgi:GlpG protein
MRCVGEIKGRKPAEAFVAYLLTKDISTHVDASDGSPDLWEVWVRDEDRLAEAIELLNDFQKHPSDPRYQSALREAGKILAEKSKQREKVQKNVRRVKYKGSPLTDRRIPPLTLTLIILCCAVTLLTNFGNPGPSNELGQSMVQQLGFVLPSDYVSSNGDPAVNLKKGQVWRAITPIFLHLHPLHLVFNMFGLVIFGRITERWLGTPQYAILILAAAVLPNLLQGLSPDWMRGNPLFGGISGVVYGLFGYVWTRTNLNPNLGIVIPLPVVVILIAPLLIGFSGLVEGWRMADLAHLGGLIVGATAAFLHERNSG